MDKILDCNVIRNNIVDDIKTKCAVLSKPLKLSVIRVDGDESCKIYVKAKRKICEEAGILLEEISYPNTISENTIIDKIIELNEDESVTAILPQFPMPSHIDKNKIINAIDYKKDVDGLTNTNTMKLINNENGIVPGTPAGIIRLFKHYNIELESKNVLIINRSRLVGIPLIHLLLRENATVTVAHSKTTDLKNHMLNADIIICAVGIHNFIKKNMIKDGTIIIDVGISRIEGKVCGDADFNDVIDKVKYITKVPGGVGLLTTSSLIENIYKCYTLK